MKRFLMHVSTYWCGMDNTFRAEEEGYFIQKDQDNHSFYLTDLDVIPRD